MKLTILFFFILIFFWWCIRLPVSCVVLWGKLSGSFVALPPFQALKVTAFLSRVCKKKCIYLSMCQHTQLPTYQTCSFIAQLCNIVCIRFRFELYSHMDWSNHVAWGLIQTRKMSYFTLFLRFIHVKLRIQECFLWLYISSHLASLTIYRILHI